MQIATAVDTERDGLTSTHAKRLAYGASKRLFDIVFSLPVIAVMFVPGVVLGIAISLESPGGPMFRQRRIGKDGKEIRIFKFRSMYPDAHEHPERYLSEEQMAQWIREQKVDDDPRVTRLGRFIRKTSLDEVPQFINVLMGDMSVIGPRPVLDKMGLRLHLRAQEQGFQPLDDVWSLVESFVDGSPTIRKRLGEIVGDQPHVWSGVLAGRKSVVKRCPRSRSLALWGLNHDQIGENTLLMSFSIQAKR